MAKQQQKEEKPLNARQEKAKELLIDAIAAVMDLSLDEANGLLDNLEEFGTDHERGVDMDTATTDALSVIIDQFPGA